MGADVAVLDVDGPAADRTSAEIVAAGRRSIAQQVDVSSRVPGCTLPSRPRASRSATPISRSPVPVSLATFQAIDVTSVEHFDRVMAVNVRGSFLTIREAVPQMRRRGHGACIVLSSLDGLQAETGMASYCTSKGALLNLARAAALDLAREGITVNAVCPSVTFTPLLEGRLATLPNGDEVLASYAAKHPLGRVLTSRDIAAAIMLPGLSARDRHHRRGRACRRWQGSCVGSLHASTVAWHG